MGYITLEEKALLHNFNYFAKLGGVDKLMVGLKDNAYGHGIDKIAEVLSRVGAKHTFVRSLQEAESVADLFETILILIECPRKKLPTHICTAINSLEAIHYIPEGNSVELAIDTGMHRDGVFFEEIPEALRSIKRRQLHLRGVFTHFATAGEDMGMMKQQQTVFDKAVAKVKELWQQPFRVHCANTAATSIIDTAKYDMNRVGLGIYGYSEYPGEQQNLQPVMALYAERIASRKVVSGESVGYGGKPAFIVPHDNFIVSNYDIGYGNGFFRLNENKKATIADGRPILGRVSMDSFSVEGNDAEVCVFNNARNLAKVHDTIVYEILVNLHANIDRRLV